MNIDDACHTNSGKMICIPEAAWTLGTKRCLNTMRDNSMRRFRKSGRSYFLIFNMIDLNVPNFAFKHEFTACRDFSSLCLSLTITASALQHRRDSCYQIQSGECGAAQTSSGRPPALITSPTLIPPVLQGVRGQCLMSFRVESGGACCGRDERCTGITHT